MDYVNKTQFVYPTKTDVLPGLTHQETAILAGVLTGLATFLFLAIPILCCLCPFPCVCCPCCGKGGASKKKTSASAYQNGGYRDENMFIAGHRQVHAHHCQYDAHSTYFPDAQ